MSSLASCLKKTSKILSPQDADTIRSAFSGFVEQGMSPAQAADKAVDQVLQVVLAERSEIVTNVEKAGGTAPQAPVYNAQEFDPDLLISAFADFLADPDNRFSSITEARRFAKEHGFDVSAGTQAAKTMEEQLEIAIVRTARRIAADADSPAQAYDDLVSLYDRQPKLGQRTSKSMVDQAYSTPMPLAYLASRLAGVGNADVIYEPTAGNGSLLIEADPARQKVYANEIDAERADALRKQGFDRITQEDAVDPGNVNALIQVEDGADVIIMNPPFGPVKTDDGSSQKFTVDKLTTTQIDHAIALQSLRAMTRDDTRAVMIVGSVSKNVSGEKARGEAYNAAAKRKFFYFLYNDYNVVDHFTVSGDLYSKQGAAWPVDVIVVQGRGKSSRALPAIEPPAVLSTWEDLKGKLDAGPQTTVSRPAGRPADIDVVSKPSTMERPGRPGREDVAGPQPDTGISGREDTEPGAVRGRRDFREPGNLREQQPGQSFRARMESKRRAKPDRAGEQSAAVSEEETPAQLAYQPASTVQSLDTLIPSNMQTAAENALLEVEAERGNIDGFVAAELGYTVAELPKYFGAEQIDAVALAIHQIKNGKAFIIGDQTGIGKGRVNAAVMRWAMVQNKTPVFLTEKPNLYGDMIRDLNDIGIEKHLGRPVNAFMTNATISVPLDQAALEWFEETMEAKAAGEKVPAKRGKFLKGATAARTIKTMKDIAQDGLGKFDIVFTTYDQMNTQGGQETDRRRFVSALVPDAVFAFDESHNAFGTVAGDRTPKEGAGDAPPRAKLIRKFAEDAAGVMFSSATYAKRADGMDLYARTDLGDAVENVKDLGDVIAKGGVPLQQVVASMLSDSGQYVRRERSFEGIEYNVEVADVDQKGYSDFSRSMSAIVQAEALLKNDPAYEQWIKNLAKEGAGTAMDTAVGDVGVTSANFTSLMHNVITQFLLGLKAGGAADMAIEMSKAGKKPVLTVANTNEAFIARYADENDIDVGSRLDVDFSEVIHNYLERTRRVTVKLPDDTKQQRSFPLDMASEQTIAAYRAAEAQISNIQNVPISPIDYMIDRMERAGLKVGEITGRNARVRYKADGTTTLDQRDPNLVKAAGRRATLNGFNNGKIDAMLINRAGSTGLSAHASKTFKDQRPRHMIIVQAEANIDTHMQILGRINRTGQVVLPGYTQLAADVPAEARPAAVLAKKMASLNANTTASRKSAVSSDAVDFMNKYGDQVVQKVLTDNFEWQNVLAPNGVAADQLPDLARKATGKLVMLPVDQQRLFLDEVQTQYAEKIEMLDRLGENELEAKFADLQAQLIERDELKATEGPSPFQQAVYMDKVSIKSVGRAYQPAQIAENLNEQFDVSAGAPETMIVQASEKARQRVWDATRQIAQKQNDWMQGKIAEAKTPDAKAKLRDKSQKLQNRFQSLNNMLYPGNVVDVTFNGEKTPAIVLTRSEGGKAETPMALSKQRVKLAIPTTAREINLSFSAIRLADDPAAEEDNGILVTPQAYGSSLADTLTLFDEAATEGREERFMITGNIVSGFDMAGGKGQIINYTDDQGNVQPGVLMSRMYDHDKFMGERPIRFKNADQLFKFMDKVSQPEVQSTDGNIAVIQIGPNEYEIELPRSRRTGGQYFLQSNVRKAADDNFNSVGDRMRFRGPRQQTIEVLDAMAEHGAMFQTRSDQDTAMEIVKGDQLPQEGDKGFRRQMAPKKPAFYSGLLSAIEGLKQPKAPAGQWKSTIAKQPGVKAEEIEWTGLNEWLDSQTGSIAREDVVEFVRANQIQLTEKVLDEGPGETVVSLGSWQDEEPSQDFIQQNADEGLNEAIEELAGEQDIDPGEVDVDEAKELALKTATDLAWSDPDRGSYQDIIVDVGGRQMEFTASQAYGEMQIWSSEIDGGNAIYDGVVLDAPQTEREVREAAEIHLGIDRDSQTAQFERWTLPGGTNYRELLLTLPRNEVSTGDVAVRLFGKEMRFLDEDQRQQVSDELRRIGSTLSDYRSSHFDESNILAHVRLKDRTSPDGKKVLFVEEIQSDWHQAGREGGYLPDQTSNLHARYKGEFQKEGLSLDMTHGARGRAAEFRLRKWKTDETVNPEELPENLAKIFDFMVERAKFEAENPMAHPVPDAPFKTTWSQLAFKRVLREAAEKGYDRVAWTTGEQQADRYDLSNTVSTIAVSHPGKDVKLAIDDDPADFYGPQDRVVRMTLTTGRTMRFALDGEGVIIVSHELEGALGKNIGEVVGKEMATKIMSVKDFETFSGEGLKIGGEGMRVFYDRIVPNFVRKYVKKWGAKVEAIDLGSDQGATPERVRLARGMGRNEFDTWWTGLSVAERMRQVHGIQLEAHSIDITPQMRASVMGGQALFQVPKSFDKRQPVKFTDKWLQREENITEELHALGKQILGHSVSINLVNKFPGEFETAHGLHKSGVIWVAMRVSRNPKGTLSHEAIHELRDRNAFTPAEWTILNRMSDRVWMDRHNIEELYAEDYGKLFDGATYQEALREEGIAQAFADYVTNKRDPESGRVVAIFDKLLRFFEAIRNALAGHGFKTVEDIFSGTLAGEVGRRGVKPRVVPQPAAAPVFGKRPPGTVMFQYTDEMGEEQYRSFTPPVDMSVVEFNDRNRPLLARIARSTYAFLSNPAANGTAVRRILQDRFIAVKKYQQAIERKDGKAMAESMDAYQAESLYYGRAGQRLDDLRNDDIVPLIEEINKRGLAQEDVDLYLYARHAPERNAYIASINKDMPDGGSGMTDAEAFEIIEGFHKRGKLEGLREIEPMVRKMLDDARKTLVVSGLIDRATFEQWSGRYANYVPLRGWENDPMADTDPQRLTTGRRFDVRGKEAHAALGRRTRADSPLGFVIAQSQQAIVRAEKNRVGKTFLRLVQNNPNKAVWEINKKETKRQLNESTGLVEEVFDRSHKLADNVYAVKVGGQTHHITLHDIGLAHALKGLGSDQMSLGVRMLARLNRYLSLVNTAYNPEFVIRNFIRDMQTALIHLTEQDMKGLRVKVLKDLSTGRALKGAYDGLAGRTDTEWSRHFRDYADAGGKIAFFQIDDVQRIKDRIASDMKDLSPTTGRKAVNAFKALGDMVDHVNMSVENGVRLATYVRLVEAGQTKAKAASAARELTVNFNRKGEWGHIMNALFLFYNASVQGNVRMLQALHRSKAIKAIALGIVIASAAIDQLNRLLADDDDDGQNLYDKIPFYVKERNFILMIPSWMDPSGAKGSFIKFPLPWGYNVFHVLGMQTSAAAGGPTPPLEAASNIFSTFINSFNPIGGASTIMHLVSPTVLDPVVDINTNKDWLGRPVYPHEYDPRRPRPDSQRYFNNVWAPYKYITEKVNELTGGSEVRPGAVDVSPATLELLGDYITGGAGMFATRTSKWASALFSGEEVEAHQIPFARNLVGTKSAYWDRQLYYEISDQVLMVEKEVKVFRSAGQADRAQKVRDTHSTEFRMIGMVKTAENQLRQLRKQRRAALARKDAKSDVVQKRLDSISKRMDAVQLRIRKKYYELEKAD